VQREHRRQVGGPGDPVETLADPRNNLFPGRIVVAKKLLIRRLVRRKLNKGTKSFCVCMAAKCAVCFAGA
jgi:hypothetical protein